MIELKSACNRYRNRGESVASMPVIVTPKVSLLMQSMPSFYLADVYSTLPAAALATGSFPLNTTVNCQTSGSISRVARAPKLISCRCPAPAGGRLPQCPIYGSYIRYHVWSLVQDRRFARATNPVCRFCPAVLLTAHGLFAIFLWLSARRKVPLRQTDTLLPLIAAHVRSFAQDCFHSPGLSVSRPWRVHSITMPSSIDGNERKRKAAAVGEDEAARKKAKKEAKRASRAVKEAAAAASAEPEAKRLHPAEGSVDEPEKKNKKTKTKSGRRKRKVTACLPQPCASPRTLLPFVSGCTLTSAMQTVSPYYPFSTASSRCIYEACLPTLTSRLQFRPSAGPLQWPAVMS